MRTIYNSVVTGVQRYLQIDAHYFMSGGFWLVAGQVIALVFGLATTALFAHYLSEADYGIYKYLTGLAVIFSAVSLTGLGQSVLQASAKKYYGFYKETVKANLIYNIPVVAIALLGAGYYFYKDNIILSIGCVTIAFLQPIVNTFQFVPAFLQGSGRFKESTILHGLRTAIVSTVSIITLLLTQNILLLLAVFLMSTATINTLSYKYYKPVKNTVTPLLFFKKYLSYAKKTSIRNFISTIAFRADSILVFTQLGAAELAAYTIALVIPEQIKGTFKSLATLLLPKFAHRSNINEIKTNVPKWSFQFFIALSAISLIYILIAPFLYNIMFPKYESVVLYSQIIALSFPALVTLIPTSALQSQLHERGLNVLIITSSIVMVIFSAIGIIFYGLLGAIIAKVLYRYILAVTSYTILYKNQANNT